MGDGISCMGISHRDPLFVMVGTTTGKILRTIDGGASWQEVHVPVRRDLFYGVERQDNPDTEYGLGLPGKSPYLQSWLRSKGLRTSGVNHQQLLVKEGDRPVTVNWIEVDWHNENRVWVATADGLYRSMDKGRTFVRIWQGHTGASERYISTVATDPSEPNRLLVGTAGGLFVSENAGATMKVEFNYYIFRSYVRAVYFDTQYAGLVHMAMGGAAMASPDSGRNWITTYWDLWGPRSTVKWISLGPENVLVMATDDGIFASFQGGEMGTWIRRGFLFTGFRVNHTLVLEDPRIWYVLTDQAVWRSDDAGETFRKVMQTGGSEVPIWIQAFNGDPNQVWLLTNRHVYRTGQVPRLVARQRVERPEPLVIPPLSEFWRHVVEHKHVYFDDVQRYRERAPWAALMPSVYAGGNYIRNLDQVNIRVFPYLHLPFTYYQNIPDNAVNIEAFATWDLGRLLFDKRELPNFGRIERLLREIRTDLTERVIRLYGEYKMLAREMAYRPPTDLVAAEAHRTRLQEITSFFDVLSDGYWSKQTKGVF